MGAEIMSVELQNLVVLQELDQKIHQVQEKVKRIPNELRDLDKTLQESRKILDQTQGTLEINNRERRRLESEVEVLRQKLSRFRDQERLVKTNKEYQALVSETENVKREIAAREDEILERMVAAEECEEKNRLALEDFNRKEAEISARKKELETFAGESALRIEELHQERERLEVVIAPELLHQYRKIATARNGVALAAARDHSCQACHVRLRPQLYNDLKMNQRIITCESCNRILYYSP
jgi:uncharacterized protein